ncbi:unnamed protein product [Protopolystoma xenopodis]|uniref:TRPM-like domain-containing protein n=1 Tax=Protopolystoma xenopodis TaxID=117903 RepID=A0A448X3W6_9PLAT|nr:unnamed protein product [Protopolystoma xenopodis]
MDTPTNRLNLNQLEIAIRLNRADIARDKIFLEGRRWKKNELDEFLHTMILNDQNEFVQLMIDQGFNFEEFLSVHRLEKLYTDCLHNGGSKTELFQQMWERRRIYKMDWVMLRDIGKILKDLIGDFYEPLYLSSFFQKQVVEVDKEELSEGESRSELLSSASSES